MIRRPPRSTLFPSRRSSDLPEQAKRILAETDLELYAGNDDLLLDRKSTRLNSSHVEISYAVFCLKKKTKKIKNMQNTYKKTNKTTNNNKHGVNHISKNPASS